MLAAPAKRKKETTESAMPSRGIALSLILTSSAGNLCLESTTDRMNASSFGQNFLGLKHLSSFKMFLNAACFWSQQLVFVIFFRFPSRASLFIVLFLFFIPIDVFFILTRLNLE